MRAAIVDPSGDLLYFGNVKNAKFAVLLPGNTQVDEHPPSGADHWDGFVWSTNPPPVLPVPPALVDGPSTGNATNSDLNDLKALFRAERGL